MVIYIIYIINDHLKKRRLYNNSSCHEGPGGRIKQKIPQLSLNLKLTND